MPNRGSYNRRTGKSTPRNKVKTHWGAKGGARRSPTTAKTAKPAIAGASKKK